MTALEALAHLRTAAPDDTSQFALDCLAEAVELVSLRERVQALYDGEISVGVSHDDTAFVWTVRRTVFDPVDRSVAAYNLGRGPSEIAALRAALESA